MKAFTSDQAYRDLLRELHRKDGECLKCGKWITEQTFNGSLCRKCDSEFQEFEEQKDIEYLTKNPHETILDPKIVQTIFMEFVRGSEVFVFS